MTHLQAANQQQFDVPASRKQKVGAGVTAKQTTKTPFSLHIACVTKRK
jgi:hypothetical protein